MGDHLVLPVERVADLILELRGQRVMLDADLARVYAVSTKRLNEQVKRNRARFPADFMFQGQRRRSLRTLARILRFPEPRQATLAQTGPRCGLHGGSALGD